MKRASHYSVRKVFTVQASWQKEARQFDTYSAASFYALNVRSVVVEKWVRA